MSLCNDCLYKIRFQAVTFPMVCKAFKLQEHVFSSFLLKRKFQAKYYEDKIIRILEISVHLFRPIKSFGSWEMCINNSDIFR